MASLLYQTIEQISRDKHIEPEIIVAAIEDAMVVAARKYYKTEEDLRAKFDAETGQISVFAVRAVVDEVTDPNKEWTLAEAKKQDPNAARGYFERAAQLDPDLVEVHMNLGLLYEMAGDRQRARSSFETFLAKASPAQYGSIIPRVRQELAGLK